MDIGFYIIDCDNSLKNNALIALINNISADHPYDNVVLFNSRYNRIDIDKKFPILHISQAKYFQGTLIYFDAKSATLAKTFPGPSQHFFCCDYPEWGSNTSARAILWKNIYEDPKLNIVTYEKNMRNILELCWNKTIYHIPHLTAENLYNVIQQKV